MRSGAPYKSGENREAGENPARSRHCEDRRQSEATTKPGDLPNAVAAFECPRKGVQAAMGIFSETIPSPPVVFRAAEGGGILIFSVRVSESPQSGRSGIAQRFI